MDFRLSDEQQILRRSVREFAVAVVSTPLAETEPYSTLSTRFSSTLLMRS